MEQSTSSGANSFLSGYEISSIIKSEGTVIVFEGVYYGVH